MSLQATLVCARAVNVVHSSLTPEALDLVRLTITYIDSTCEDIT